MDQKAREDLKTEMAVIDAAQAPIMKLMEPLRTTIAELEEVRAMALLRHGLTEAPTECEGCQRYIIAGDKYCPTDDAGPLCESCSPTFGEMRKQCEESADPARDDEDLERDKAVIRRIDEHVAGGGSLNDKYVFTFEV